MSYQLDIFTEILKEDIYPSASRFGVPKTTERKVVQVFGAKEQKRVLTQNIMEEICSHKNIDRAYKQVKKNKGAAGTDGMPVERFASWYTTHGDQLIKDLLHEEYLPMVVKAVEIPKPSGGFRMLGIPTVIDRVIQQAISQVLTPIYEQIFSPHSYGFRPKRSTHQAIAQVSEYVEEGYMYAVDMDLSKFFDEVNHDRLMHHLSQMVGDKRLLSLIGKYLRTGILQGGMVSQRIKGTPQGSPLSPLLSNIVLDELDKELEQRGYKFVRYADDFIILVRSKEASERVKRRISSYLTNKLKLRVNEAKSTAGQIQEKVFLGYTILKDGRKIIPQSRVKRLKDKIRTCVQRNRGDKSLLEIIKELNSMLRGWVQYYRLASSTRLLRNLDSWMRRKLRCFRLKQCKRVFTVFKFLYQNGVEKSQSWRLALSGKGWWRKSSCPQVHQAMNISWFEDLGLVSLPKYFEMVKG